MNRKEFEATLRPEDRARNGIGFYLNPDVQAKWEGWLSALEWLQLRDTDVLINRISEGKETHPIVELWAELGLDD